MAQPTAADHNQNHLQPSPSMTGADTIVVPEIDIVPLEVELKDRELITGYYSNTEKVLSMRMRQGNDFRRIYERRHPYRNSAEWDAPAAALARDRTDHHRCDGVEDTTWISGDEEV